MNNMIPVPVIASFSTEGKIMPLYFRYKECGSIPVTMKTYIKYITCLLYTSDTRKAQPITVDAASAEVTNNGKGIKQSTGT